MRLRLPSMADAAAEARKMPRRLRSFIPHSTHVDVVPVRDLEAAGAGFRILGDAPGLSLTGPVPRGFVEVRVTGWASAPTGLTLFAHPEGRPAPEVTLLGRLLSSPSTVSAFCALPDHGSVELRPVPFEGTLTLSDVSVRTVSPLEIALQVKTFARSWRDFGTPRRLWDKARDHLRRPDPGQTPYDLWRLFNDASEEELTRQRVHATRLNHQPKFSIVVPVYAPDRSALERCVESVKKQVYPNWELCLADDASPQGWVREYLTRLAEEDPRVRVVFRKENGHISEASNSALALATGEFVALLDNDDELSPDALYEVARALDREPDLDLVYSDEDKLDENGRRFEGRFKPDWSPELLLSQMYIGHLGVYRRSIVEEIRGFRKGYEGSQDHDLALRFTERTRRVRRIPRVLYHWRVSATSAASGHGAKPYAIDAARRALEDALERRGQQGFVEALAAHPGHYTVHCAADPMQKVSIVIPTRDGAALLERCLSSLVELTKHPNWEVCVVDNGSRESATLELFSRWKGRLGESRFKLVRRDEPFNFSRLINAGAQATDGQLLLLLNNDTEIIDGGWLDALAGYARQPEIGAVGCRLLYPDGVLQHAGIALDPRFIAVHAQQFLPADHPGYFGQFVSAVNFSAVTGACLMVRREVFQAVGGLDEQLAVAYNDVDFCLRVQALGLRNVVLGHVRLVHHESRTRGYDTSPEKRRRLEAEGAILRDRWGALLLDDPATNPNLNPVDYSLRIERTRGSTPGRST